MSIFKESFPEFVKKQLEQREKTISSGAGKKTDISGSVSFNFNEDRSNNFYAYQQKQCILRLSSGVDITDPGILDENKSGAEIAKRWVLEGGIKDGNTNRGGIGTGGAYGDSTLRSNADDGYGIVPMPGITSANIRTKSAYGSLREAKVNFVCHNRRQLEVLELLYMRPGYTLLLEWQWSPFIDNDGKVDYTTIKKIDFFNKNTSMSSMEKNVESYKEETGGNYDALIGYCKNFTYKLRGDGGFDCETEIIAKGEVLESLKDKDTTIRMSDSYGDSNTSKPNLEIFLADLVAFNNAFSGVGGLKVDGDGSTQAEGELGDDVIKKKKRSLSEELASKIGVEAPLEGNDYNLSPFILTGGPSSFTDWGEGLNASDGYFVRPLGDDDERGDWGDWEGFWSIFGGGSRFRTNTTWVRWDVLCYCINKHVIPLNEQNEPIMSLTTAYLSHPDDEQKVYLEPLMYSSKKRATSYITDKITQLKAYDITPSGGTRSREPDPIYWITDISVNNQICMLPHNLYQYKDAPDYKVGVNPFAGVKLKEGIMKKNFYKPLVKTLVDKTSFQFKSGEDINRKWGDDSAFSQNNIGGIYFGAEYLLKTFRGMYYTSDGNINKDYTLFNFIKKIWEEVNACTQSGHDFDIQTDNRGGCDIVRIIDRQMDNSGESVKDPHVLKIQTLDSVVRDVTYNTTIPSSLSSTIAIAAQSPDSIDDLDKVSFAALNKGIKDRFSIKTTTNNTPSDSQIIEWNNKFDGELIKVHGALYLSGGGGVNIGNGGALINLLYRDYQSSRNYILKEDMTGMSPKNQSSFKGALKNVISALNYFQSHYGSTDKKLGYYRGQPASDGTQPLSAVIPLKFNAKLDGISGIVIGNVFKIPKDRLPMAYGGNDINFIVMGEEQSIDGNQDWTTTISGHLILLGNVASEEYQKSKHYKSWKNPTLTISQNAYLDVRIIDKEQKIGGNPTGLGNNLAGSIVGSMLGDPLESISVNGDNVFGQDRGYYGKGHKKEGEKRIHKGVDLEADSGAILYAVADGTVSFASGGHDGWGGAIKIKFDKNPLTGTNDWSDPSHKGTTPKYALYAHAKKWWKGNDVSGKILEKGDKVKKGESIGLAGGGENDPHKGNAQGAHLHLEFYLADNSTKIDPLPWIPGRQDGSFGDNAADNSDGDLGTGLDEKTADGGVAAINNTPISDAISGERVVLNNEIYFKGWPKQVDGKTNPILLKADLNGGKFIQTGFTTQAKGGFADTGDMTHLSFGRYVKDGFKGTTNYWVNSDQSYADAGIVQDKLDKEIDGTEYGMMLFPEFQHYELYMYNWEWRFKKAYNLKYIK